MCHIHVIVTCLSVYYFTTYTLLLHVCLYITSPHTHRIMSDQSQLTGVQDQDHAKPLSVKTDIYWTMQDNARSFPRHT